MRFLTISHGVGYPVRALQWTLFRTCMFSSHMTNSNFSSLQDLFFLPQQLRMADCQKHAPLLDLSEFDLSLFKAEVDVLRLIVYRNKNQHRVWRWWQYVEMITKRGYQLVDLIEEQERLEAKRPKGFIRLKTRPFKQNVKRAAAPAKLSKRAEKRCDKAKARIRYFEQVEKAAKDKAHRENDDNADITKISDGKNSSSTTDPVEYYPPGTQARHNRIRHIAHFLYTKLIPTAYRNFHSHILGLAFFITLGFGLLGAISRLFSVLEVLALQGLVKKPTLEREIQIEAQQAQEAGIQLVKEAIQKKQDESPVVDTDDVGEKVTMEELQQFLNAREAEEGSEKATLPKDGDKAPQKAKTKKRKPETADGGDLNSIFGDAPKKKKKRQDVEAPTDTGKAKKKKDKDAGSATTEKKRKKKKKSDIDDIFGAMF